MQFNRKWKDFLLEERYPDLLLEARVRDVKAKYKVLDDSGWVNWGQRQIEYATSPKGVSKYLMWFAREMDRRIGVTDADELRNDPDVLELAEGIIDRINIFNLNQHKLEEKDIYKYHDEELKRKLDKLGVTTAAKTKQAEIEKEKAREESEVVYNEHGVLAIRPLTTHASCYYGENPRLTDWCISTKTKRNYFKQYTESEGKAFIIVKFTGLPEGHENHLVTLEYNHNGELISWWNSPNKEHDPEELSTAVEQHLRAIQKEDPDAVEEELLHEVWNDLELAGRESVLSNPPMAPIEAARQLCEDIEAEATEKIRNDINIYHEVEDESLFADGRPYIHFGAAAEIAIDVETGHEEAEKDVFSLDVAEERRLQQEIENIFTELGLEDVVGLDVYVSGGDLNVRFRLYDETIQNDIEGFQWFCLERVPKLDRSFDQVTTFIESLLVKEGYKHNPSSTPAGIEEDIQKYFKHNHLTKQGFYDSIERDIVKEEKGRSRQRGIYKFYCMLSYGLTVEADRSRGLDDILADLRALPNVTIVTVVIKNQKISEGRYIAGLSIKFIPSVPGEFRSPEDVKSRILRDIRRLGNVKTVFKVSAGLERLE